MTNATHMHSDGSIVGHRFEAARLGVAPFLLVGVRENVFDLGDGHTKAGGTCDYCGNGIRWEYVVRDATGKSFVLGSECARHTGDEKLYAIIASEERKRQREKARLRRVAKAESDAANAEKLMPEYRVALAKLESLPHPHPHFSAQGKTLADYYRFFEFDGGNKAHLKNILSAIAKAEGK